MGCPNSKIKKANRRAQKLEDMQKQAEAVKEQEEEKVVQCDASDAALIEQEDVECISVIRRDLNENPEIFVLNNVLMCIFFLRNYQEEIHKAEEEVSKPQEHFWEPHTIVERANLNVIYRPMHGPKKDIPEPLITRRIYVPMDEYIAVCDSSDEVPKELNHSCKYQVKMEESKRRGFVRLQRINGDINPDGNSLKDLLVVPPPSSNTSGSGDTSSIATSNGISSICEGPQLVHDEINDGTPDDCFVYRKKKKPDADLLLEDGEDFQEEDVFDIVSYLQSGKFLKYFQSKVFKDAIAEQLSIVQYEIDNAVVYSQAPGKVFCNIRKDIGCCYPVELMPCLKTSWPHRHTYEFLQMQHESDSRDLRYQWPNKQMFDHMQTLPCAIVPKGYAKNGKLVGNLEWQIHFPLAERYLETLLRPEQIKCYHVLLTLFKAYIEPNTKNFGVLPEHLMNLIFWETERNNVEWPTHRLGFRLISIIKHFSKCLSQKKFQDYFVRTRNVFRSIPQQNLDKANETFHAITQSPVMQIIRALRNIRYLKTSTFYPTIDYKNLLGILYKKEWDENPFLSTLSLHVDNGDNISVSTTTSVKRKPRTDDAVKELKLKKEKQIRKKIAKQREDESRKNSTSVPYHLKSNSRRGSSDSVNDNWECEKRFDIQKKIGLLKFFIDNYIEIAKISIRIASKRQTLFYLKQAWYLTKILEQENQLFAEEVVDYFKEIKKQEAKVIWGMQKNVDTYGSLDVLNNNTEQMIEKQEEDLSLAALDDVRVHSKTNGLKKDVNIDQVHQQIRQTKINLSTLSKSFKPNYFKTVSIEEPSR